MLHITNQEMKKDMQKSLTKLIRHFKRLDYFMSSERNLANIIAYLRYMFNGRKNCRCLFKVGCKKERPSSNWSEFDLHTNCGDTFDAFILTLKSLNLSSMSAMDCCNYMTNFTTNCRYRCPFYVGKK